MKENKRQLIIRDEMVMSRKTAEFCANPENLGKIFVLRIITSSFFKAIRSGTARSKDGAERDRGTVVHLVENNNYPSWQKAICGLKPKGGNGWHYPSTEVEVTCKKCLEKLKQINNNK